MITIQDVLKLKCDVQLTKIFREHTEILTYT